MREACFLGTVVGVLLCLAGCGDPPLDTTPVVFEPTGAIQTYTVPKGATALHVVALGASGGDAETADGASVVAGGYGAEVDTIVDVERGAALLIVVGEQPILQLAGTLGGCGASGGGGSFVVLEPTTPLVVAGGGGGASGYFEVPGQDASTTRDGVSTDGYDGGQWGFGGESFTAGGGGGLSGDGESYMDVGGGAAFVHGAAGGARDYIGACFSAANGGFGGGGGGGSDTGAGGGGYSGGAAGYMLGGGGGGSYQLTGTDDITVRTSHGHGSVIITPIPY